MIAIAYQFYKGTDLSAAGNNGKSYQPAIVETFNGKDTKDEVNILILGSHQRAAKNLPMPEQTPLWLSMWAIKEGKIKMVQLARHLSEYQGGLRERLFSGPETQYGFPTLVGKIIIRSGAHA